LANQPPASGTFLSEQISHQQLVNSTFLSKLISTSHQPNEQALAYFPSVWFSESAANTIKINVPKNPSQH
jgi:hypothetical protein